MYCQVRYTSIISQQSAFSQFFNSAFVKSNNIIFAEIVVLKLHSIHYLYYVIGCSQCLGNSDVTFLFCFKRSIISLSIGGQE